MLQIVLNRMYGDWSQGLRIRVRGLRLEQLDALWNVLRLEQQIQFPVGILCFEIA